MSLSRTINRGSSPSAGIMAMRVGGKARGGAPSNALLLEDGTYLLLEDGGKIVQEA